MDFINKGKIRKSAKEYEKAIVGIVSTQPAIVIEGGRIVAMGGFTPQNSTLKPAVALAGRVPVKVTDENGKVIQEFKPEILRSNMVTEDNLQTVKDGMREAVSDGIIYPLRLNKVKVAAKTGTAEFGVPNAQGVSETHAWTVGFAPFDSPKISFVVLLEAGGASSNAAEVANDILNWYFGR